MLITIGVAVGLLFLIGVGYLITRVTALSSAANVETQRRQQLEAEYQTAKDKLDKYSGITDVEAQQQQLETRRKQLETEYQLGLTRYTELNRQVSLLEENLEDLSFGLYKPHFSFQTSDEYKTALTTIRVEVKSLIKEGKAVKYPFEVALGNSRADGKRMVSQVTKIILRAFNGECDAALANVTWSNISKMEERIQKSFEAVNKLEGTLQISITPAYLELRLKELRLANEYESKKYHEKEEQRDIREKMKEEQKALQEIEEKEEEAEKEEVTYQTLLAKARKEASEATGARLQELTDKVATFEGKLDEARRKKERAISRAQQTKSGFVYVISNIGAFGKGVFKIGMTRRMEPLERIAELSGASVPFPFDLHAMMFSMNAPELETALHTVFDDRKVNLVNNRKEFYHNIDLVEIEKVVKDRGLSAQFIEEPEAREYRETLVQREQRKVISPEPQFASALFQ